MTGSDFSPDEQAAVRRSAPPCACALALSMAASLQGSGAMFALMRWQHGAVEETR